MKITFKLDNARISKSNLLKKLNAIIVDNMISNALDTLKKEQEKNFSGYLTDVWHHEPSEIGTVTIRMNLLTQRQLENLLTAN